ncbi:MAG: cysteine--tRNA ligase [Deltaproteobacteria bacterium]|nr:cysteine--tRNA ligase [Deltaproteobacteria bacterium]
MTLKIYNTMTRQREVFEPQQPGKVGIYACGVTVYDLSHIGHARAMVVFDVIQRYLRTLGYEVTFVRNYTDIDDKIINRANEEGVAWNVISERYIEEFDRDMAALGIQIPEHTPRATDHIPEMLAMVSSLIGRGHAYEVDGDVYFDVSSFKQYGKLSGKDTESLQSGARVDVDERKKSPLDFALWKAAKPGEPYWESPWGRGRPGWHIECSAMSQKYLGETFDIHGGGMDLVFPHHENEIAQAECSTGKPFARYWLHNGFVNIDKEKMSKSLKNFKTIRDVLADYHPEVIRLFLLTSQYRSPVDFSAQNLAETQAGLDRFYALLQDVQDSARMYDGDPQTDVERTALEAIEEFPAKFKAAMDDDFNTAQALGHLYSLTRILNAAVHTPGQDVNRFSRRLAEAACAVFRDAGSVFGLFQSAPASYFAARKQDGISSAGVSEADIQRLIDERLEARRQKNWERADEIRDELAAKGIVLKDTPQGTEWSVK